MFWAGSTISGLFKLHRARVRSRRRDYVERWSQRFGKTSQLFSVCALVPYCLLSSRVGMDPLCEVAVTSPYPLKSIFANSTCLQPNSRDGRSDYAQTWLCYHRWFGHAVTPAGCGSTAQRTTDWSTNAVWVSLHGVRGQFRLSQSSRRRFGDNLWHVAADVKIPLASFGRKYMNIVGFSSHFTW